MLPEAFCWTRFGVHAGEPIEDILERKEAERIANGGRFLWGVGNSVAPAISDLVHRVARPEVLFSPIKSRPRVVDARPTRVVVWTAARLMDGRTVTLPDGMRVRSHTGLATEPNAHYALVCASDVPLGLADDGVVRMSSLRNLVSGRPIGASQVTAVVVPEVGSGDEDDPYIVAMRARLVAPYFLRLMDPVDLSDGSAAAAHGLGRDGKLFVPPYQREPVTAV